MRPVEEKPAGAHRTKGEKANKKQVACIGCVYSVDRHARTPELIGALQRVHRLWQPQDRLDHLTHLA